MTQEALKLSQEALAGLKDVEKQVRELVAENKALKKALAHCPDCGQLLGDAGHIHTCSPQRLWVGLSEDDKVLIKHDANYNQFMTAGEYADRVQQLTEARLKDKNI